MTAKSRPAVYRGTPDVLGPNLTVLFVGFNPGTRSGETGHHYAGRGNRFWSLLADSGLLPRRLDPAEDRLVLARGYGLTNLVRRTTPGSGDLAAAEMREGAQALRRKIEVCGPRVVCYLGKGVYAGSTGRPGQKVSLGLQRGELVAGSMDFVAHSPSGRAAVTYEEKLAVFRDLASLVEEAETQMLQAWRLRFAHNIIFHALAARTGETVTVACDSEHCDELRRVLLPEVQRSGARLQARRFDHGVLNGLGEDDCLILAPSAAAWRDPQVRALVGVSGGEQRHAPEGPKGRFRTVLLPPMPAEAWYRAFSMPYREHVAFHDRLMVTLKGSKHFEVTAPGGTAVSFEARPFVAQSFGARSEGRFMLGIPGEVTTAPVEDSVEGVIAYDPSVYLGMTSETIALKVRGGRVDAVARSGRPEGSKASPDPVVDMFVAELQQRAAEWPDALRVGEFGLGTSASARYSGCIMEDEIVMGSCHFDLGANVQFGGTLRGPFHGGGMVSRPTVKVDGVTIVKDGLYVDRNLA